jgi:DNA repair protein RadC
MKSPIEFKITRVRECPTPAQLIDTPEHAMAYWRAHVETAPWYDESKECLVVLILNAKHRIVGHNLVSLGGLDNCLAHPREVFRPAIVAAGYAIILMHNHPSGDPTPSFVDLQTTREIIQAGRILKIELLDHVIVGNTHVSMKELGYFGR